jgi:aspartate kinase
VTGPLVIKFGGDAVATPERIARAARRIADRSAQRPVAAVASARRGVTDHLLSLVARVRGQAGPVSGVGSAAADRAVASGEIVAASLLALALEELGLRAAVLDAREAGLGSDGRPGDSRLVSVRPRRVRRLMDRGVVPVVTGFQGWHRGRLTTLGRGGSDVTAVALAAALDAEQCELVKEAGGLHTADPALVPDARPIARTSHRFVAELAAAGARVIHHLAAEQAERDGVRLRFAAIDDGSETLVEGEGVDRETLALAHGPGRRDFPAPLQLDDLATVTLVSATPEVPPAIRAAATAAAAHSGIAIAGTSHGSHSLRFVVARGDAVRLLRVIHAEVAGRSWSARVDSGVPASDRGGHVGHR